MIRLLSCLFTMAFLSACGSDSTQISADATSDISASTETDVWDGITTTDGTFTISVEVTFPADSVTSGYRPVAAVYKKSVYSDFSLRPDKMPTAALLGVDGAGSLMGPIMDFGQTQTYEFPYGEYSVVVGIAETNGLPKPVVGTLFIVRAIRTDTPDTHVVVVADDPDWTPY